MAHQPPSRTPVFYFITALLALILLEGLSYVGVRLLDLKKIYYQPHVVHEDEYAKYLAQRDPLLGWPSPLAYDGRYYDLTGSRIIPAYPDPLTYRTYISLYGDSMTESLEVDSAKAWSNVLATLVRSRVANYGGAGYGTDQALLRFLHNVHDDAPIVFLNHFSENILRNVNQYRFLLANDMGHALGFKPRFIINHDSLELVPMPTFTYEEYVMCCRDPSSYLPHEFYIPDNGVSGIQTVKFPYLITLLQTFNNHIVNPKIQRVPRHIEFYSVNHPSQSLRITYLIMKRFDEEARSRQQIPVLTILPDGKDLEYYLSHGEWTFQSLLDSLTINGLEIFNFGPEIIKYLDGASPCEVINDCYNHFNEEGYRMVAHIAYEHLRERNLLRLTDEESHLIQAAPRSD